jgi:hypothetical protein
VKYFFILSLGLFLFSCTTESSTNQTPAPASTPNAQLPYTSKYTRAEYIRIFECTLNIKDQSLKPADRGTIAAHLSLIQNDFVWEASAKKRGKEFDLDVSTISNPLGCK